MRDPRRTPAPDPLDPVRVTAPGLVALARQAGAIGLDTRRIRSRMTGEYLSPFRGRGMEFDEARIYQPGDDIRNIDWRVTARTGRVHTKMFREERERPVFLWVDLRTPMFFATRGAYKSVIAARAAGLVAWSAQQRGDRVGGLVFSDSEHHEVRPQRGKPAVLHLINRLAGHPAWTDPAATVDPRAGLDAALRMRRLARPGSLVFLISDFRGLDEDLGWVHPVAHMADLLWRFALHPSTTPDQGREILRAVRHKVAPITAAYAFNEPDRLARAISTLVARELVPADEIAAWIESFATPASMEKWSDAFRTPAGMTELHNTKLFLRALSDQLDGEVVDAGISAAIASLVQGFTQLV